MQLDDALCLCFHVTKRKVLNFLRVHRPRRASEVSQCGGAGTGCGWCRKSIERYFQASRAAAPGATFDDPESTAAEYAQGRQDYIAAGHGRPPAAPG